MLSCGSTGAPVPGGALWHQRTRDLNGTVVDPLVSRGKTGHEGRLVFLDVKSDDREKSLSCLMVSGKFQRSEN